MSLKSIIISRRYRPILSSAVSKFLLREDIAEPVSCTYLNLCLRVFQRVVQKMLDILLVIASDTPASDSHMIADSPGIPGIACRIIVIRIAAH